MYLLWRTSSGVLSRAISGVSSRLRMQALSEVIPAIAQQKIEQGGFMVLRPDSGDPVEAVLDALHAAERVFGVDINQKGFKVPKGCGVIQGDGINIAQLAKILEAVHEENYSAQV